MNKFEKWIESQSDNLESVKKNLIWQLSFENADWEFFRETVDFAERLQNDIEEKELSLKILRYQNGSGQSLPKD